MENFKSFFPDFFLSSNEEFFIQHSTLTYNEQLNRDDQNLSQIKIHGGFNKEKGLWEYPSVTTHKPKEIMNEHLVNCTEERNDYIHSTKIDTTTGLYQTFHLKPCTTTKEDTEILSMWYELSQTRNIQGHGYLIHPNRSSQHQIL